MRNNFLLKLKKYCILLLFIFSFPLNNAEAAPIYENSGAFIFGNKDLNVPVPSGYNDDDLFLLFVESANEEVDIPAGWTEVTNSPQFTGTPARAGGVRLTVFYKIVSGAQSSVIVNDAGEHTAAIITRFSGVDPSNPIHLTSGSTDDVPTDIISTPALTTALDETLIVNAIGLDKDATDNDTIITDPVNSNLINLIENFDRTISTGDGGGIAFFTGDKLLAGDVGNTTATADSATTHAYLTIALKPIILAPTLIVQEPNGVNDSVYQGEIYDIEYTLIDSDDVVTASFYYDTDNFGVDGVPIAGSCSAAPEGVDATCSWNTGGIPLGSYYVYGIVDDGTHPAVIYYSLGMIIIEESKFLSIDIVDSGGTPVISPMINFPSLDFSYNLQQATATLGDPSQIIRISNKSAVSSWTVSVAASLGNTSLWNGATYSYDYNGSLETGRLMIDASSASVVPELGCDVAGITKNISTYFSQGITDQIDLVFSNENSPAGCYWDITGIVLIQDIPPLQQADNYSLLLTLTAV